MRTIAFLLTIATQGTRSIFDEIIHRPATLLQNSVFGLKLINGFGYCGVLATLISILSDEPDTQIKIAKNVYDFLRNCDKDFD